MGYRNGNVIVVTGATGHVGNVLIRELLAQGYVVRALVLPDDDCRPLNNLDLEIVHGDITNPSELLAAFSGADLVFHLAGIVTIMPGMAEVLERVNVGGIRNVITACRATGVRRLVYTCSIHAIAEPPHGTVIDEVSKGGLDAVICCPTGIIGPFDHGISNIGQLILDFASGRLKSYVSGAYDFVDVRDVARGLILASRKGRTGRHYIFSGTQVQVPDLMAELAVDIGYPAPTYRIPAGIARAAGVLASIYYRLLRRRPVFTAYSIDVLRSNSQVSSARAREELGFTTSAWQESIRDHVEWFRTEGMLPTRH